MDFTEYKNIWIYVEQYNDEIPSFYYELLGKAQTVARDYGDNTKVAAVVLGDISEAVEDELKCSGVDLVYIAKHDKLKFYNPENYSMAFAALIEKYKPCMVWVAATSEGSEVAPSVAAKMKTGLAAHCVDIFVNDQHEMVQMVPAFGGKVLSEILVPDNRPIMASIKPGIFQKTEIKVLGAATIIVDDAEVLDTFESRISFIKAVKNDASDLAVEKAEIVVCGGLGIGNQENWDKVKKFAAAINGTTGYTRPLIDIGLEKNEDNMIGTSGKSVRPQLYIGFGVSGASHHLCGMKDSKMIISVNSDDRADILNASDYQIVSDCGDILDALLKELG